MRRGRGEQGQTELVIVFPVALAIVLLVLQAGLWFLARSVAIDAARDGARAVAVMGGTPGAGRAVASADLAQLAGPTLSSPSVTASRSGNRAVVTVSGQAESILPGWSLTVSATAAQPVEEFRP